MRKVYHLIRQMGVTSKYKGYYFVADAVKLSMETAGYPLSYKPTNSEFVDMLAFYLSSDDR